MLMQVIYPHKKKELNAKTTEIKSKIQVLLV